MWRLSILFGDFFEGFEAFFDLFQFVQNEGVYIDRVHTDRAVGAGDLIDLIDQGPKFGFFFYRCVPPLSGFIGQLRQSRVGIDVKAVAPGQEFDQVFSQKHPAPALEQAVVLRACVGSV